jgi:hypothetical protein
MVTDVTFIVGLSASSFVMMSSIGSFEAPGGTST